MNELSKFFSALRDRYPQIAFELDAAGKPEGVSFIYFPWAGHSYAIEFRPKLSIGLFYNEDEGIGSRPDEIYYDSHRLFARLDVLLRNVEPRHGRRLESLSLRDIRELLCITQSQIASTLGKQQSAISKIEQRDDVLLSTLLSLVHGMGGTVEIRARFKEFELPIYVDENSPSI